MSPSRLLMVLTMLLVAACGSRKERPSAQNANILLVTLDTTRADHIGAYGYAAASTPVLDRLAGEGVLFEHCITPSAYTLPSHSSIMTGLYPPAHGVRLNGDAALADEHLTLAEQLAKKGYRTGGFVGAFVLDGRWGISQGFDHYDDKFELAPDQKLDLARVQRTGDKVVDAALSWLDQDRTRPFFAWVHMYDAHTPYDPPEPFKSRFASSGPNGMYDGEISFADSQVGRLLQWLDQRGLRENTIVVITSDHGEGLGSHGEGEHGYYVYDYAVRVPLIVRIPGVAAARIPAQVRTVDIAPTLLELIGAESGAGIDGQSMLPLIDNADEALARLAYSESVATKLQYGWSALYSLRTNDHKFIEAPRSELYDLGNDPGETKNRLDDQRRVAVRLKQELAAIRADGAKRAPKAQEANLDSETMSKLASLGYLGGGSASLSEDDSGLADPKDKMHLYESVGYAANLMSKNDYKQAVEVLEIVLGDDPDIPQAQLLVVSAYRKTEQTAKAKSILDAYLKKDPGSVQALIGMAEILAEENRMDEVLAICRSALAKDASNARAYELMADVHMTREEPEAAVPLLRKAVQIQPKLSRSQNNLSAALIGTGQLQEAETLITGILRDHPKFPLANFHMALLREKQGRPDAAKAAYEAELKMHPDSTVARFNLGELMLRLRDVTGAEAQMRTLIQQDPQNARPYLLLARVLMDRPGSLAEVERLAQAGLTRATEPDLKALGYFLLADVYSREGRRAELQEALRKGQHYRALIRS